MKFIALAKIILASIWLQRVAAREEDGMRDIDGTPDGEEGVQRSLPFSPSSCVKYGSTVYLKSGGQKSGGDMWLSGGQANDRNYVHNRVMAPPLSKYQWVVRSTIDDPDPSADNCVHYNQLIYLGIILEQNQTNTWLTTGLHGGDNAVTSYGRRHLAQTNTAPWTPSARWTVSSHISNETSVDDGPTVMNGATIYLRNSDPIGWLKGLGGNRNGGVGKVKVNDAPASCVMNGRNTANWYEWTVYEST